MPRAKTRRARSRVFDASIWSRRFATLFGPMRSRAARSSNFRAVEVGDLPDQAFLEELVDERLSQSVDVHGPARGEMEDGFPDPGRAGRVDASGDGFSFRPEDGRSADGALLGPGEGFLFSRPPLLHHRNDVRDDVAAPLEEDDVADADVLAPELVLVVEGRAADRRAGELDRLEHGDRRQGARSGRPG